MFFFKKKNMWFRPHSPPAPETSREHESATHSICIDSAIVSKLVVDTKTIWFFNTPWLWSPCPCQTFCPPHSPPCPPLVLPMSSCPPVVLCITTARRWLAMAGNGQPWPTMKCKCHDGSDGRSWLAAKGNGTPWLDLQSHAQPWLAM